MNDEWKGYGACADLGEDAHKIFVAPFERLADPSFYEEALAICKTCTVVEECYEYAIHHSCEFGVWGGRIRETEVAEEKRQLRRKRSQKRKDNDERAMDTSNL